MSKNSAYPALPISEGQPPATDIPHPPRPPSNAPARQPGASGLSGELARETSHPPLLPCRAPLVLSAAASPVLLDLLHFLSFSCHAVWDFPCPLSLAMC